MDLVSKVLDAVRSAQAGYEAAIELAGELKGSLSGNDQQRLKDGLGAIAAENDAGHARLQQKLQAAARR